MSEYFYALDARKHYKDLMEAQKDMFQAFINLDNEIFEKKSALPRKIKELIAIAVAHTTQCPYCIEGHVKAAKRKGPPIQRSPKPFSSLLPSRPGGTFAHSTISMGVIKGMEEEVGAIHELSLRDCPVAVRDGAVHRNKGFFERAVYFWTLFQKYVFNQFQAVIRTSAESQPRDKISPWTTGLPEIPPAPLYQRGVGGDFRDELAIQNSLPNLEFLDVDPAYRLITYF